MRLLTSALFLLSTLCLAQTDFPNLEKLINEGQYTAAIQEINSLLQQNKSEAHRLNNRKALLFIALGNFDEAETLLKQQDGEYSSGLKHAITASSRGFMHLNRGNFDKAMESLDAAMQGFQNIGQTNILEAAQCLSYLGQLFYATGKYNQSIENQLLALQIKSKLFEANHVEIAASYTDLGLAYSVTNPEKALDYYEMALPIYEKIYGNMHAKVAVANTNIGAMYNALELYGDAQNNFESALSIWKKLYPNGHPNQALVLMSLGRTYQKLKNLSAAKGYYKQAIRQYQNAYGAKHPDIASALNQLGLLYIGENKFDSALNLYQQALIANSSDFTSASIAINPKPGSFYNGMQMLYSLAYKAQALEEKYLNKTLKLSQLITALKCLQTADTLVDVLRQNARDENDKIAIGALANEVYGSGVRVAQTLSEVTAQKKQYAANAFYFAEKSKAAVLLESIADANAKSFAGIPADLLDEETRIKADIAYYSQKLAQKPDEQEAQIVRKQLFDLNTKYEAFTKSLETKYPEYFNLKFNTAIPGISQLQAVLPDGTAIVSYFMDEKPGSEAIYLFTISNKNFSVLHRRLPANTDKMIRGFTNSIFYSAPNTYWQAGEFLSKLLRPKLSSTITDLILIPSGKLGTIPFEALPLETSTPNTFPEKYWIHKYAIGYEFASTLLVQKSNRAPVQTNSIFLCAPIEFPNTNLNTLPGTEAEVNTIAGLFGTSASLITANKATESQVKATGLNSFKYIHFATHGVVDEQTPELSRIFLKQSTNDDGNLYSGEIFNLSLNADLVALSACQTGLGKISKGEGVIGLSRALVYAGARNVMVSYWSVADESTALLMTDFYKNVLRNNTSYRKNLQQVKTQMIAQKKYGAPFYWAPFVIIGN